MFGRKKKAKKARPRSRAQRILLKIGWLVPIGALLAAGAVLIFTYAFAVIPLPNEITLESATIIYDVNGKKIAELQGDQRRYILNQDRLARLFKEAPHVGQAVIAAEDRDFYDHNGVSLRGLARAAWANLTGGEIQQGGSTISQQYVKNAVLKDPSRTITRKFKEAILAIKLERRYSKREILGFYLNTIYLGRGAYGIEAAADAYFNKDASELSVREAAYLAAIIPSPESYQPQDGMATAVIRRDAVLSTMVELGFITEQVERRASRPKVETVKYDPQEKKKQAAAYFVEWLRDDYLDPLLGTCAYTCGLKIYTTLDLDAQNAAEDALAMTRQPGWPQAALVSMTPTGEVRAMVGGKKPMSVKSARGFNYATTSPGRQPGSSFKPFTLLTALEEGISPESHFSGGSPVTIENPDCNNGTEPWQPENYGGSSYGTVDLETATANSINTVYAQLIGEIGPQPVADLLTDFQFRPEPGEKEILPRCSLALGGYIDVTPLEMARGYAGFSNRGALPELNPVRFIKTNERECINATGPAGIAESFEKMDKEGLNEIVPKSWADCDETLPIEGEQIVERNNADILNDVMTNVTSGTAVSANITNPAFIESGKTGTTQDNKDAWFVGSVPSTEESSGLTTAIWMGYPLETPKKGTPFTPLMSTSCIDPRECRPVGDVGTVTGGSYPAQMWSLYMSDAVTILGIQPGAWPIPDDYESKKVLNSPAPPASTYVPPAPPSDSEEPSEEPTKSEEPTTEPPPPPPSTSEPPPPPSTEPPPPPSSPPVTPPGRRR
jgi:penicillin-binding protein 1A